MCYNGAWTFVCHYDYGYQEAFVVCRHLGLPATGNNTNTYQLMFGSGPVLFNSLECVEKKSILANCNSNLPLYSSSHSTDVGIRCMNEGM